MNAFRRLRTRSGPRTGACGTAADGAPWRLRAVGMAAAVFCLTFLLAGLILFNMEQNRLHRERERVAYITSTYAARIQHIIGVILQSTYTLEALVKQEKGTVSRFDAVAGDIFRLYPGLYNVALAPGGVIRQIFPPEPNRAAVGHDLLHDPARMEEARAARDTGRLTVAGPFDLIQGGRAVVGRLPVFWEDSAGKPFFWGFVCTSFRFPEALAPAQLPDLEAQGYAYALWRQHPDTGQRQVLASSKAGPLSAPLEYHVELPNTRWTFSVAPIGGWEDYAALTVPAIMAVIICLLLAFLAGLLVSLAARKKALEQLSRTDILTGLANRRMLMERLERAVIESAAAHTCFALCYMDLDGFKDINDTLGHKAGDDLLRGFALRLASGIGVRDTAARLGGDEFVLILRDVGDAAGCRERLNSILPALREPFCLGKRTVRIGASIGIALYPDDGKDEDILLRRADHAMYQCKRSGVATKEEICFASCHV